MSDPDPVMLAAWRKRRNQLLRAFDDDRHVTPARILMKRSEDRGLDRLELFLSEWVYLANKSARKERPQFYYAFFDRLLVTRFTPARSQVRFLARILRTRPTTTVWREIIEICRVATDEKDLVRRTHAFHHTLKMARNAREEASCHFDDIESELRGLLPWFVDGADRCSLEQEHRKDEVVHASTDGQRIALPDRIALAEDLATNTYAYVRLLVHEAEHISSGSFEFSFATPRGRELWKRLEPRRGKFRDLWRDRKRPSLLGADVQKMPLSHLTAFFEHFEPSALARMLYNLVEDMRVERNLARKYPGLAPVVKAIDCHVASQRRAPPLESVEANFIHALIDHARAVPPNRHILRELQPAFANACGLLDTFKEGPTEEVADSLHTTLDLVEVFENDLPDSSSESIEQALVAGDLIDFERQAHRILDRGRRQDEEERFRDTFPWRPDHTPDLPGTWREYPEYEAVRGSVRKRASRVREVPWDPIREAPGRLPTIELPALTSATSEEVHALRGHRKSSPMGTKIDPFLAHAQLVSLRTGRPIRGVVFERVSRPKPRAMVSFVIDLSVSMEAERRSGGALVAPLSRATQLTNSLASRLMAGGHDVGIFGAHDGGRRSVSLHVVQDWGQDAGAERVASLHALGAGGFRHGAAYRHLAWRGEEQRPGHPHLIVLVTDNASHYAIPGFDRVTTELHRTRCPRCVHRHRCPIEPRDQKIFLDAGDEEVALWHPISHETADLAHAVSSNPEVTPYLISLEDRYTDQDLDEAVGRGHWSRVLSENQFGEAARIMRRLIKAS